MFSIILFIIILCYQGQLKQRCRENEYCLRLCLEGMKDSNTFVSENEKAEIESKMLL